MGCHDAGHTGDDLAEDAGGSDAEPLGQDVVRRDATLADEVGGGEGQAIDNVDEEVADLLAQSLALVGIVEDALHVDLDGAGAFGLQELFQLLRGLLDMRAYDEAAGIERGEG